jgi:hypothetical protein
MYEVFNMFLDDEVVDTICNFSTVEASRFVSRIGCKCCSEQSENFDTYRSCGNKSVFCVLLIAGSLRCRKETISEMWTADETIRRAVFTAAMAQNRFAHILQFVRFDDKSTRVQRKVNDILASIREVSNRFVNNCKKLFELFEDMTVDEQPVAFRGKCPMRQYMKSKPAKYGIMVWAAVDLKNSCLYNKQVYTGKLPGNTPEKAWDAA